MAEDVFSPTSPTRKVVRKKESGNGKKHVRCNDSCINRTLTRIKLPLEGELNWEIEGVSGSWKDRSKRLPVQRMVQRISSDPGRDIFGHGPFISPLELS